MADWFVALAAGGRPGALVADGLAHLGIACYRPRYRVRDVSRGRKIWREQFLFGQYVLVEMRMKIDALGKIVCDWANQFHEVVGIIGIRGVLGVGESPLVVRGAEVDRLRSTEHHGYVQAPKKFGRDQRVKIRGGAFAFCSAVYKFSCENFDYVSIDGLAARVVRLPLGSIEAV
jgi:transcription antitermination factor NusG